MMWGATLQLIVTVSDNVMEGPVGHLFIKPVMVIHCGIGNKWVLRSGSRNMRAMMRGATLQLTVMLSDNVTNTPAGHLFIKPVMLIRCGNGSQSEGGRHFLCRGW